MWERLATCFATPGLSCLSRNKPEEAGGGQEGNRPLPAPHRPSPLMLNTVADSAGEEDSDWSDSDDLPNRESDRTTWSIGSFDTSYYEHHQVADLRNTMWRKVRAMVIANREERTESLAEDLRTKTFEERACRIKLASIGLGIEWFPADEMSVGNGESAIREGRPSPRGDPVAKGPEEVQNDRFRGRIAAKNVAEIEIIGRVLMIVAFDRRGMTSRSSESLDDRRQYPTQAFYFRFKSEEKLGVWSAAFDDLMHSANSCSSKELVACKDLQGSLQQIRSRCPTNFQQFSS
eukprot:GHVU01140044.1.p1 GENE.GHVU01140044.1~~GHVU01140044.1.p1  ORF type:complete len:290 (+),score=22.11 GHVU01140044.1:94-963(+)